MFRVHADERGETHVSPVPLPLLEGEPERVGFRDVPASTLSMSELMVTKPDSGWHPAPRRQLVVVLRGGLEITTSAGDRQQLWAGDCLLAEDVRGDGHLTRQIGDECLSTLTIGIAEDWQLPG